MISKDHLLIIQVNLCKGTSATESALQSAIELKADIVLVQEPRIIQESEPSLAYRSINHPAYIQLLPPYASSKPRVIAYIARDISHIASLALNSPNDPDILILELNFQELKFFIYNIYNQIDRSGHDTLDRVLYTSITLASKAIVLGDFNIHHP